MATYRITAPDGTVYNATGEGTEEEALAEVQRQHAAKPAQPAPAGERTWGDTAKGIYDKFGRMVTNADPITGGADLIGTVMNMGIRKANESFGTEIPTYRPKAPVVREALGINELPADAPAWERVLETAGSIALGGGGRPAVASGTGAAGAAVDMTKRAVNSTIDAVAGDALAQFGGAYGGDLGALTGALAGGLARPATVAAAGEAASKLGNSRAGEIYDASQRLGVQPTAGMVGNDFVGGTEKTLSAFPILGAPVNYARDAARSGLEDAASRAATSIRGGPAPADPVLPGHVGDAVLDASRTELDRAQTYAKGVAEDFARNLGNPLTSLDPVDAAMSTALTRAGPTPERAMLAERYAQLQDVRPPAPVITPGQPAIPGTPAVPPSTILGPNGQPAFPGSPAIPGTPAVPPVMGPQPNVVPYNDLWRWSQSIGRTGANQPSVPGDLFDIIYGGTKDARRAAADPITGTGEFDTMNQIYTNTFGRGGIVDQLLPIAGGENPRTGNPVRGMDETGAYNMIAGGMKAPERMEPFVRNLPPEAAAPAFGNFVDTLGRPATPGPDFSFSPTKFTKEWNATMPESRDTATRTAPGAGAVLDDVATAGQKYDLPPQAYGLTKSLGSLGTAMAALAGAGAATTGPTGLAAGLLPLGVGMALESRPVVRGIAGRYSDLMTRLRQSLPATLAPNANAEMDRPRR